MVSLRSLLAVLSVFAFSLGSIPLESPAQPSVSKFPQRARRRSPIESNIFLGDWWDYYNRAIRRIEAGDLTGAESDLRDAIKYRPDDDTHARTYGVRFQEYYANLELGTILFLKGSYAEAVTRLENSMRVASLDETKFFLHESRRRLALERGDDQSVPQLVLTQPPAGLVTNQDTVIVAGTVSDDIYVDEVYVGNESVLLPKASSRLDFEWEIDLKNEVNRIPVVVRDLVGRESALEVVVTVDKQGPVFNLKKIELVSGGDKARIVGDAYDRREVASISLNGATLAIPGGTLVSVSREVPLRPETKDVQLALYDGLGNVTRAVLDPRMKVGKARGAEVQVRVAAVGFDPRWLSGATAGPKIDLMGLESGQKVFLRDLYIDGYVRDPSGIESITFEGNPVDIPEGKDLYFSHLAGPLTEGTNNLEITALNVNRVETKRLLNLECELPPEYDLSGRLAVSIPPFDLLGTVSQSEAALLQGALQKSLLARQRFNLVANDELPALFLERTLGQADVIDTRWRAGDQEFTEADLILDGQLISNEETLSLFVRVTRVQNGRIEAVLETHGIDHTPLTLERMARGIALKLESEYPIVSGEIFQSDPQFLSTLARETRIKVNSQVLTYRKGPDVILPSGKNLGAQPYDIGTMLIKSVLDEYSIIQPSDNMIESPILGDRVVTR